MIAERGEGISHLSVVKSEPRLKQITGDNSSGVLSKFGELAPAKKCPIFVQYARPPWT